MSRMREREREGEREREDTPRSPGWPAAASRGWRPHRTACAAARLRKVRSVAERHIERERERDLVETEPETEADWRQGERERERVWDQDRA